MQLTNKDFKFVYNPHVMQYLHNEKRIPFLCRGLHPDTFKPFWQFLKTDELQLALSEYRLLHNK